MTMADKSMNGMPGMNMGDPNRAVNNTDPTKDQHGMDTGPAPSQPAGTVMMPEAMKNMPLATPRIWTVTGTEDWSMLRGFGKASGMVTMMNEMMVAGSPMGQMKMGKMDMSMAQMPAPTPEEARMASATTTAPASLEPAVPPAASQVLSPVSAPPPPATPSSAGGPLTVQASLTPSTASVANGNVMTVTVTDAAGKPVTNATITSTVVMTTMDMGTTHPAFKSIGGGKYQGKVGFGMSGPWRVTLHVTAPGQKPLTKAVVFNAK